MIVELASEHERIFVTNVHLEDESNETDSQCKMLDLLRGFMDRHDGGHFFIMGDWNFITSRTDRISIRSGQPCGSLCSAGRKWMTEFQGGLDELFQPDPTRFPGNQSQNASAARLDRIYQSSRLESYAIFDSKVSTHGIYKDSYLSDHLPVIASMRIKASRTRSINRLWPSHPFYVQQVQKMANDTTSSKCCWARVLQLGFVFYISGDFY